MTTRVIKKRPLKASGGRRKVSKTAPSSKPVPVPENQLNLPAGFSADRSRMVTLREVLDPKQPTTLSLAELSPEELSEIVVKRIEAQPKFELSMVGVGRLDKERAIAEIRAHTKAGRILTEIEQRVLNDLIARGTAKPK